MGKFEALFASIGRRVDGIRSMRSERILEMAHECQSTAQQLLDRAAELEKLAAVAKRCEETAERIASGAPS